MNPPKEQIVLDAIRTEESDPRPAMERLQDPRTVRLLHVAMGLATEAGEFVDILKKHIFYGKPIDAAHAVEELGDISWYQRCGVDALETTFAEMLRRNTAKLMVRYPEKYSDVRAENRDLTAERNALESEGV